MRAVAPLGGASGAWIEAELEAAGIAVYRAATGAEPRVCVSVAGEGQELTEFYEGAPELLAHEWDALAGAVREAAVGASWVTLSGSLPPGSPADGMAVLIDAARSAGALVALDAREDDLRAGVRSRPDLVKVNEHEAADLLGGGVGAQALRPPGGVACITHGARGLELAGDGFVLRATPPVRGRYPVGCGDVTLGALVAARDAGADWREAVALAVGAAAAAAEVPGAGVLDPRTRPGAGRSGRRAPQLTGGASTSSSDSRMNPMICSCSGVTCESGPAATIWPRAALLIMRMSGPPSSATFAIAQRPNTRPSTLASSSTLMLSWRGSRPIRSKSARTARSSPSSVCANALSVISNAPVMSRPLLLLRAAVKMAPSSVRRLSGSIVLRLR